MYDYGRQTYKSKDAYPWIPITPRSNKRAFNTFSQLRVVFTVSKAPSCMEPERPLTLWGSICVPSMARPRNLGFWLVILESYLGFPTKHPKKVWACLAFPIVLHAPVLLGSLGPITIVHTSSWEGSLGDSSREPCRASCPTLTNVLAQRMEDQDGGHVR